VLGSSLTVTPANEIPAAVVSGSGKTKKRGTRSGGGGGKGKGGEGQEGGKLVICNLQATPLDGMAGLRVFAGCDDLMGRVMRELGWEIPGFVLRRRLRVEVGMVEGRRWRVSVEVGGVDVDGTAVSFLRSVKMVNNRRVVKAEPFIFFFCGGGEEEGGLGVWVEVVFFGGFFFFLGWVFGVGGVFFSGFFLGLGFVVVGGYVGG
jgi:mono-ADP-ribosyltransferase sirtuin 6